MKLKVLTTKIELLYSGNEDGFYQFNKPVDEFKYVLNISVLKTKSLNLLNKEALSYVMDKQNKIKKITTLNSISYKYRNISVCYYIYEESNILGIFAMGESQPAKYVIYSLAFFSIAH